MALRDVYKAAIIILIFTGFDYILHLLGLFMPHLSILPANYFINKLIYGTLSLFALLMFFPRLNFYITAYIVAIILQFRYYTSQNYNNYLMIFIHGLLIVAAYYIYERYENKIPRLR